MEKNKFTVREITLTAGLAALSAVVQLIHIGYQSPQFGMWIDIVAVTWIIALFLFGLRVSFLVSIIGAIIITFFAPDTWLGASMKWLASFPIWLVLGLWIIRKTNPYEYYRKPHRIILPILIAIIIRCVIIIPINYYYAIPLWTGMTPSAAMAAIPWYIIAIFNSIQSVLDVAFAWILVYKFRLERYAASHES